MKITDVAPPPGGWVITHCECSGEPRALEAEAEGAQWRCPCCRRSVAEMFSGVVPKRHTPSSLRDAIARAIDDVHEGRPAPDGRPIVRNVCISPDCNAWNTMTPLEEHRGKLGCPLCKRVGTELKWQEQGF